jgi:hypothetical protein
MRRATTGALRSFVQLTDGCGFEQGLNETVAALQGAERRTWLLDQADIGSLIKLKPLVVCNIATNY